MKSILKRAAEKDRQREKSEEEAIKAEITNPATSESRRNFLKKTAIGGIALGGGILSIEDTVAQTTQKVQRSSSPTDLKITDMRTAKTAVMGGTTIIRIDTNQGIYGLGEVRDGADSRYALMLKSRILGENPCNVEKIFKIIKQFGYHGRQGGGVCAVEMAMWDLCGKAYNVPAWQLLGGRYRDKVRMYADTPGGQTPEAQRERIKFRIEQQGFTWLKMDLGIGVLRNIPGTLVNQKWWMENDQAMRESGNNYMSSGRIQHPFTQIQITDKGLEEMAKIVEQTRELIGWDIPIFTDHFGHFDYNNAIRLGRALEKYRLGCMEDCVAWYNFDDWKKITDALETPTMTGEDIYCLEGGFQQLIDQHIVDIIHPDLATSGGLLETKRIGDYAEKHNIAMAMHQAGTPVSMMANIHCAAATQNVLALEHHSVDLEWWPNLVKMTGSQPIFTKGYGNVPLDSPGLGIELNDDVVKQHMRTDEPGYFLPTPEWDQNRSGDWLFS
jgi:L-alanine-DL-glutamate epimerase-like enolase superfamily enzyme